MSSVGRALVEHLEGLGEPRFVDALREQMGGRSERAFAAELGVPRSTLKDWLSGAAPRGRAATQAGIMVAATARRFDRAVRSVRGMRLHGRLQYNGGGSPRHGDERDIPIGDYLDERTGRRLVRDWEALRGNPRAAARQLERVLWEGIRDAPFYEDVFMPAAERRERDEVTPPMHFDVDYIDGWG